MPTYEQLMEQTGRDRIQRTTVGLVGIAVASLVFLYPSLSNFLPAILWSGQAAFEGNWMRDSLTCFSACYAVMAMSLYMRTCLYGKCAFFFIQRMILHAHSLLQRFGEAERAHRSKDLQFLPFASYVLAALSNLNRSSGASSVSPVVYAPILLLNTPPQFLLTVPHRAERIHFLLPLLVRAPHFCIQIFISSEVLREELFLCLPQGLSLSWSVLAIRPITSEIVTGFYVGVSLVSIGGALVELALL